MFLFGIGSVGGSLRTLDVGQPVLIEPFSASDPIIGLQQALGAAASSSMT